MFAADCLIQELRCGWDRPIIRLDHDDTTYFEEAVHEERMAFSGLGRVPRNPDSVGYISPCRCSGADEPGRQGPGAEVKTGPEVGPGSKTWTTAVEPKPLSQNVKKGSTGWSSINSLAAGGVRGRSRHKCAAAASLKDTPNVADTCIAVLALIRSGSTPREGLYRDAIVKGVRYVRLQVDESDSQSIAVTRVQGTRVQQKLGPNIDTFLASILLAEVKGRMPDEASEKAADLALHKVLGKIERHQKQDGSFDGQGWAPILAQAMCGKGINRARAGRRTRLRHGFGSGGERCDSWPSRHQSPPRVRSPGCRDRYAIQLPAMGRDDGGGMMGGSAGVELYSRAASVGVLQDSVNTQQGRRLKHCATRPPNPRMRRSATEAKEKLAQIADAEKVQQQAQAAVVARLDDKQFVAGFGSNGGEEFLSYMNHRREPGRQGRRRVEALGFRDDREPQPGAERRRELVRPATASRAARSAPRRRSWS